jgi:excisionase family DNA binding protein
MISLNQTVFPQILNKPISVQVAASYSGYCLQYLRRLLRNGKLEGVKISQLWLVDKSALDLYIVSGLYSYKCTK